MEQFAIGANLESAAARGNQLERLDALAELKNFGRQTDGLRRVVSNDAVFDRYLGLHQRGPFRKRNYRCDRTRSRNCRGSRVGCSIFRRSQTAATTVKETLAITRRSGRFGLGFRSARSEQHREDGEDLHSRRVLRAPEKRRYVEAHVVRWFPCDGRADDESMNRIATSVLVCKITILHFHSSLAVRAQAKMGSPRSGRTPTRGRDLNRFPVQKTNSLPIRFAQRNLLPVKV